MHFSTLLLTTIAATAAAWDESYPNYCDPEQEGPCISRLSESCYKCIHPIEAACPGTGKEFEECFCPVKSASWAAIEKCFNDPSTGCNDGEKGSTSETFALIHTFSVICFGYNYDICPADAKLSSTETILREYMDCDDAPVVASSVSVATSEKPAVTTTSDKVKPTEAPATTSVAVSKPATSSVSMTKASTGGAATSSSAPAVPTSNGAASGYAVSGLNAVALVVMGGVMNAL